MSTGAIAAIVVLVALIVAVPVVYAWLVCKAIDDEIEAADARNLAYQQWRERMMANAMAREQWARKQLGG